MNKKEILEVLNKYNFPKDEFIVISGAAMVLLGIKERTNDIDLSVSDSLYIQLQKEYNCELEKINSYGCRIYYIDEIINFGTTYYDTKFLKLSGYQVQTPEEIKKLKLSLKRSKDQKDIDLIDNYRRYNNG